MASNINPNNIDGTYPVAGQDNDSQGFRDNFSNIRTNFNFTKNEISDLQSKVILKSPLSGTDLNNSMAGAVLSGAQLKDTHESLVDLGVTGGNQELNHTIAHNYTITTNDAVTLSFAGFPSITEITDQAVGKIRLEITITDISHILSLPSSVNKGTDSIRGYNSSNRTITFDTTGTYHFEFWSDDSGATIHIEDKSRNNANAVGKTPTGVGSASDRAGDIVFDDDYIYVCTGNYDGSTAIWKKSALSAI